jgi:hypothetical protein
MAKHIPWTPDDDKYLANNWDQKLVRDLETDLGRTKGSILRRARALGLKSLNGVLRMKSL